MKRMILILAVLVLVAAACGDDSSSSTTQPPGQTTQQTSAPSTVPATTVPTTTEPEPVTEVHSVSSYLMNMTPTDGPYVVPLYRELGAGVEPDVAVAVDTMLKGETFTEAGMQISTEVPRDTKLLGATIDESSGVATIDLTGEFDEGGGSMSMRSRLAQVVFTATQFVGIDGVLIELDGVPMTVFSSEGIDISEPMTRQTFADLQAPVFVEAPAWGAHVSTQFKVEVATSSDQRFLSYAVTDWDGLIIVDGLISEDLGGGSNDPEVRTESALINLDPTLLRTHPSGGYDLSLIVWHGSSPSDQVDVIEYPLHYRTPVLELRELEEVAETAEPVTINRGETLAVYLEGNPSTGYGWTVVGPAAPVLDLLGEPMFIPLSDLIGASGEFRFEFEAMKSGQVELVFNYERPFEGGDPLQVTSVVVNVR